MKTATLDSEEREFLARVARAAFANPFGEERVRADLDISGLPAAAPREKQMEAAVASVAGFRERLEKAGKGTVRPFSGEDRYLIGTAFLFEIFHRYLQDFDGLIDEQVRAGDESCPVGFAGDALRELAERGYGLAEALRYFAMFYQLRRAFYFIHRSLIGRSASMRDLRRRLWNNVFTHDTHGYDRYLWERMEDFSTLLVGETGTGKGAAAAAIGRSGFIPFDPKTGRFSESFMRVFISLNLSQYPETLIESELFGHRKGAFTGAIGNYDGVFSRCSPHGSILLDEIGEVAAPVQIKLLQVIQDRTFSPVGSHEKRRFSGRVIAATNRPLEELLEAGRFREDFFYRLCSDIIPLPTLRQRLEEDPSEMDEMLGHVIERLTGRPSPELAAAVREALLKGVGTSYAWPGNVRELEQAVRRVLLTGAYEGRHRRVGRDRMAQLIAGVEAGDWTAERVLSTYCAVLYKRFGTYEEVARRIQLDRRTVKKYVDRCGE